eukprot:TRINITY_DN4271_c0_g1_i1.p1 TRINITY_DN4271_c0_g1~~TRINITY_DN4271_c0_g1_i1.p1  ORF type:complete len:229 (+),score=22.34 TRINITY_DN4271_c0_g1_i1:380-1066(+)
MNRAPERFTEANASSLPPSPPHSWIHHNVKKGVPFVAAAAGPAAGGVASLPVKAVVDAVDRVHGLGVQGHEPALVLLDRRLLLVGEPLDVVDVRHRRVRSVRYDLSRRVRVHAGELDVSAYVRVVNIDLVTAAKERHNRVVHLCQRRRRKPQHRDRAHGLLEEVAAACRRLSRHGGGGGAHACRGERVRHESLGRSHASQHRDSGSELHCGYFGGWGWKKLRDDDDDR